MTEQHPLHSTEIPEYLTPGTPENAEYVDEHARYWRFDTLETLKVGWWPDHRTLYVAEHAFPALDIEDETIAFVVKYRDTRIESAPCHDTHGQEPLSWTEVWMQHLRRRAAEVAHHSGPIPEHVDALTVRTRGHLRLLRSNP